MEGVEPDDLVEKACFFFIGAVSEDDFDAIIVAGLHFLHPEFGSGDAVGIGEEDDLVFGFLDTHAEGVFFSGDADGFLFEVYDVEAFMFLFYFVEEEAGIVLAVVVDDDDLVCAAIGLGEATMEVQGQLAGFIASAYDNADGVLLGLFPGFRLEKGQTPEEPAIIEELDQGDKAECNEKYFEPGQTQ
jgi:hypothetical protein